MCVCVCCFSVGGLKFISKQALIDGGDDGLSRATYGKRKIKCILTASERILRFIVLIKLALYLFYYSCFVCL